MLRIPKTPSKLSVIYYFLLCLLCLASPVRVLAITQDEANSIYTDTVWYDPNSSDFTDITGNICAAGGEASVDRLMQAVAQHESGGDPGAVNAKGGAYGKYQYIDSTWQGAARSYYPSATQYTHASDAPEAVQDAVTYYRFAALANKYDGSIWKIAVVQYYPAALDDLDYWMDRVPAPEAGNTQTIRQFANQIVDWVNSGDGKDITLKYKQLSDFQQWLNKNGLNNVKPLYAVRDNGPAPTGGGGSISSSCTCAQAIIATAMAYAWPTYHDAPYTDTKPAYAAAVQAAIDKGIYVGGGSYPGVDCGGFVSLSMKNSGADKDYNKYNGATPLQQKYMDDNPQLYENLGIKTSTNGLQPGDIAINSSHTYIYTGDEGFKGYNAVSASVEPSARAPMASNTYFSNSSGPFTWYRYKCPNNSGGQQ